jgi:hypothetical protein
VSKLYLALHPGTRQRALVWCVDGTSAYRVDEPRQRVEVPPGADAIECIKQTHPNWTFEELKVGLGEYYPRMARPTIDDISNSPGINPESQGSKVLIETGRGQLVALRDQLERVFRTVHPVETNFCAYGHDIRNLLILAATEVEAHWKGILNANGLTEARNTNDYVKLLHAMKLDQYAVGMPFYPWLEPIKPFAAWSSANPTESLAWYDGYNAVKHDRETQFKQAKLIYAIEAVCACAVITFAQFGNEASHDSRQIRVFFRLVEAPKWELTEVYALSPTIQVAPKPVPYPFNRPN